MRTPAAELVAGLCQLQGAGADERLPEQRVSTDASVAFLDH
jgi:hypothetical protein